MSLNTVLRMFLHVNGCSLLLQKPHACFGVQLLHISDTNSFKEYTGIFIQKPM